MAPTLHEAFRAQAARTPDAVAVSWSDGALTYRELDARTDRLAADLRASGVVDGSPVVVAVAERSPSVVIAFLAALKSGGYYLPLHPAHPAERRARIVELAGARVALADGPAAGTGLPAVDRVVLVDTADTADTADTGPVAMGADADALAYVMFTSGSTGEPKGVAVGHAEALALATDPCWDLGDHRIVPMLAPYAFNVSTYEVWVPLLRGGRVVLPDAPIDVATLRRTVSEGGVTALHVTAGLFRVVAEEDPEVFARVSEVLTGGDVISPRAVDKVLDACPGVVVRGLYGATEATVFSTPAAMKDGDRPGTAVPLGTALADTEIRVLDDRLEPVSPGEVGAVYIAGGLSRGYLHRPDLTAERFVADPGGRDGARLYRTGDLARRGVDGTLAFAGRSGGLIKIMGFRVERAEIEAVVTASPHVADATVHAVEDQPGDMRLVAHVVPAAGTTLDVGALRAEVRSALPDYMVPAAFVAVATMPLTANGKIDREALPAPDFSSAAERRAPRTDTEQALCAIFTEVLRVPDVGIDDSFFDLGGHSLLAARMLNRIRVELGVQISIGILFDEPTVAGLARHAEP